MAASSPIYLDNAATTRVAPEVAEVVAACMADDFGNPSSAHRAGIAAEKRVKIARDQLLDAVGDPGGERGEIRWTSGGTESDALGVAGAARAGKRRGRRIVYAATEHPAVRESARMLEAEGFTAVAVPVTAAGVVDAGAVIDAVTDDTSVVAVMLVNNELGTINPVADIAARLPGHVHLHCDAVQALGKIAVDVGRLGAHTVAFAGHKLHGPKGVGALWVSRDARLVPLWSGGGQQDGVRSGTFNVPGIAGMGAAVALAHPGIDDRRARWTDYEARLLAAVDGAGVPWQQNGAAAPRAPHVVSLAFRGIPAEPLLHVLESRGVLVSAGSACAERSRKPSPVLQAIGLDNDWGTLRLSFGRDTTGDDIDRACEVLAGALESF